MLYLGVQSTSTEPWLPFVLKKWEGVLMIGLRSWVKEQALVMRQHLAKGFHGWSELTHKALNVARRAEASHTAIAPSVGKQYHTSADHNLRFPTSTEWMRRTGGAAPTNHTSFDGRNFSSPKFLAVVRLEWLRIDNVLIWNWYRSPAHAHTPQG